MSSVNTIRRTAANSAGVGDEDECRTCYGVAVGCVSLLLFCVLAASVGITKACAVAGLTVVFFGVIGWFVPVNGAPRSGGATRADDSAGAGATALQRAGCACGLVRAAATEAPPAFAYECPAKSGGSVLCAVCLEDVQRGEAVRQLPACGHLFHKDCIDMWLHSHTTCPLCRCELLSRRSAGKAAMTAAESSADALPPV